MHCVLTLLGLAAKVSAGVQSPQRPRLHQLRTGTEARTALRASQQRALQPPGVSRCAHSSCGPVESQHNTRHLTPNQKIRLKDMLDLRMPRRWWKAAQERRVDLARSVAEGHTRTIGHEYISPVGGGRPHKNDGLISPIGGSQ